MATILLSIIRQVAQSILIFENQGAVYYPFGRKSAFREKWKVPIRPYPRQSGDEKAQY